MFGLLLVLLFGLGFSLAVGAAEQVEAGRIELAQATGQVEPLTINGILDRNSSILKSDNSYFNTHNF
jgi:hypothetical protein